MSDWNDEAVRQALTIARDHGFAEVELQSNGTSFQATLAPAPRRVLSRSDQGQIETVEPSLLREVTAPLVGYYQPSGAPLSVGQKIKVGDVVAVIAALGLANEVESTFAGEVIRVLVEPGQSVEFGQVLAEVKIEP